jgi:hypothetical protein
MALESDVERRARERRWATHAENTLVVDLPDGHTTIVVAHPGQTLDRDPKFLRENFGIVDQSITPIIRLSESRSRPLSHEEKVAARAEVVAAEEAAVTEAADAVAEVKARDTARRGPRNTAKAGPDPVSGD